MGLGGGYSSPLNGAGNNGGAGNTPPVEPPGSRTFPAQAGAKVRKMCSRERRSRRSFPAQQEESMAQPNRPLWELKVGEEAPGLEVTATGDGARNSGPQKKVRLSDFRGKKNVVLAFYPAAFTPV